MEVLAFLCALLLTVVKCCPSNCICEEHETTCEIRSGTDELPLEYTDFLIINGKLCPKQQKFLKDLTPNTIIVMTSHPCIGIHNCRDDRPPEPEPEPGQPEFQPGHLEPGQPELGQPAPRQPEPGQPESRQPEQPEGSEPDPRLPEEPEGEESEPRQPEQPEEEELEPRQPEPEPERVTEPELEFTTEVTTDVTTIEVTEPDNMIVPVPGQSTMMIYRGATITLSVVLGMLGFMFCVLVAFIIQRYRRFRYGNRRKFKTSDEDLVEENLCHDNTVNSCSCSFLPF